jgi:ankyrin repeat protein
MLNVHPHLINLRCAAGRTALHFSCGRACSLGCVKVLLSSKLVDVNAVDLKLRSPLHMCALNGRVGLAKALVQRGAIVDGTDRNKQTPQ